MEKEVEHQPVMLQQVLDLAEQAYGHFQNRPGREQDTIAGRELPSPAFTILDGTLGAGGHSRWLAQEYPDANLILSRCQIGEYKLKLIRTK